ncbi:Uu.00g034330.m01.CDS01 [Anthostomella pinea]|uniref:Sorting nexin-4 n=1 Tax=Anthostomella pinea TaxID=933095 RepID=A0AAI8YDB8_9PEZI|nr:Uu.00g034330.m01.CDS01 [Anthostomella pinea]
MAVIDEDKFSSISWHSDHKMTGDESSSVVTPALEAEPPTEEDQHHGEDLERQDPGLTGDILECTVSEPHKESENTKDAFVSYLVTTNSTFPSFQKPTFTSRRRFTDFLFLYKSLSKEYPACAVPPLPDKQRMEYVRGDRFGSDFTNRRAFSLQRFLARIAMHPILRRAPILHTFLESTEWNATMRSRASRMSVTSEQGSGGVFDNFADTFINAFTKVHKHDKRFIEVREKSDKLDEDLGHVEKVVARVARREADLETDLRDLTEQFQKLITLEPGVENAVHGFAASVEDTAAGLRRLREHTDQDYLGSLRDMQAYGQALKNLLKAREQKQLDHEQLTEYLNKSTLDRDSLASGYGNTGALGGAGGFIRSKIEDVRGVDHEASRRERLRKLEIRIDELTTEAERAKKTSEMFDEEVVKEVVDFERIKRIELKHQFGGLANAHVDFYTGTIDVWQQYVREMEKEGLSASAFTG